MSLLCLNCLCIEREREKREVLQSNNYWVEWKGKVDESV